MPRNETEPLRRIHLHIFERDYVRLEEHFGRTIGISRATRAIIRKFLDQIEARAAARAASLPLPPIQLPELPLDADEAEDVAS